MYLGMQREQCIVVRGQRARAASLRVGADKQLAVNRLGLTYNPIWGRGNFAAQSVSSQRFCQPTDLKNSENGRHR